MKKLLVLALVMALVLVSLGMAVTDEQGIGATVTVNEFLSVTISDPAAAVEVAFGALSQGTNDNPDLEQGAGTPAITVTNDAVSNVDVDVDVKGTDFSSASTGATIAVGSVTYDDDEIASEGVETGKVETTLLVGYPGVSYYTGVTPGSFEGFWFFLDVPTPQTAAIDYTSTFTFRSTT